MNYCLQFFSVSVLPPGGIVRFPVKKRPRGVRDQRILYLGSCQVMPSRGLYRIRYGRDRAGPWARRNPCGSACSSSGAEARHRCEPGVTGTPNLRFPVPNFFSEDPDLWFFQLEAKFIVNRVTSEKDRYAIVVANLPFKVVSTHPEEPIFEYISTFRM